MWTYETQTGLFNMVYSRWPMAIISQVMQEHEGNSAGSWFDGNELIQHVDGILLENKVENFQIQYSRVKKSP